MTTHMHTDGPYLEATIANVIIPTSGKPKSDLRSKRTYHKGVRILGPSDEPAKQRVLSGHPRLLCQAAHAA